MAELVKGHEEHALKVNQGDTSVSRRERNLLDVVYMWLAEATIPSSKGDEISFIARNSSARSGPPSHSW